MDDMAIALGSRLKQCRNVSTLGILPNFSAYSDEQQKRIRRASKIYYPGTFYADLFNAIGKTTFPSYHTYKFVQDKIKQTALFQLLDIPHPRTRVFYGKRQHKAIPERFGFPFIAKVPRGSAMGRGVYLIQTPDDLEAYCTANPVAYIQEYLATDRDIRVVVIGSKVALAYLRVACPGDFRSNVAAGARIELNKVPQEAVQLALKTASQCGWDDVGIDVLAHQGRFYILEANMKYGRAGFREAGIDYTRFMEEKITAGEI